MTEPDHKQDSRPDRAKKNYNNCHKSRMLLRLTGHITKSNDYMIRKITWLAGAMLFILLPS